ncbi:MAG TPA: glycosyltransferase [Stellaceae bacterium]|nr:glycosyltransferase [Stellaceae bacterium]
MSEEVSKRAWLTAIVPSHNGERWLDAALRSVAAQQRADIEVIVVDSSEGDASRHIVEQYSALLPIRAYRRPDLLSWMAKTNFAAENATSEWLCMLHQDDLWLPGRCAAISRWIVRHPQAVMHVHPAYMIDAAGRVLGRWRCPLPAGAAPVPPQQLLERLLVQNFIAIPTPTIRRDAYLAAGGLDPQLWYTADWDLYLKLSRLGDIHYHRECLAGFRIHDSSLTMSGSRNLTEFRAQMERVIDRHVDRLTARRGMTQRLAAASVEVNVGLAAASHGNLAPLMKAAVRLMALGPRGLCRYLDYSRIVERSRPRLRARLAGGL